MIKSYKIRLYPTKEQELLMWKHIGCARYIYNYMLNKKEELYRAGKKHLSRFDMIKAITFLKRDGSHDWLYDVSNATLQMTCSELDRAYQDFFKKKSNIPKYKSKKNCKQSFPIRGERLWFDNNNYAHIDKIKTIRFKTDFCLPTGSECKFSNARISNANGKWMLSFGMECENQAHTLNDYNVGIDLGIKDSAVVAYDDKKLVFHNINKSKDVRSIKKKIVRLQCSIARKYEDNKQGNKFIKTKNIEREEAKLRKLYEHLSGIRSNYIHQSTHTIVSLLPKRVVMEDLNVTGMMENKHLSKAVQEQSFYEWIRQLRYKCEWNGIEFVQVDRYFPSSKTCHKCGCVKNNLKLKDRIFVCDECGYTEDRDYNAALNLMSYGN